MSLPDVNSDGQVWKAETCLIIQAQIPGWVGGQKKKRIQIRFLLLKTACRDQQQLEISERIGFVQDRTG
jgi:hypothetical protein